jgi:hypothetical protein
MAKKGYDNPPKRAIATLLKKKNHNHMTNTGTN